LGGEINMIFTEEQVWELYEANLKQAITKLGEIEVFSGENPRFSGLSGWVFEKTILHCIKAELKEKGINRGIKEQASLGGRAKADLAVGSVAIELKTSGLFGKSDAERYGKYKNAAKENGYPRYIYLTWNETSFEYKQGLNLALGENNVFYLETPGEWERFISALLA
jgi:hypothetical protein